MLTNILLTIHLLVAFTIVVLVLLQQGKGSDMGAAFGGGSSQSLFGARGSANFLSRTTSVLVALFFLSSLTLAYIYTQRNGSGSVVGAADSFIVTPPSPAADSATQPSDGASTVESPVPTIPE